MAYIMLILFWVFIAVVAWIAFVEVVIRILRHYINLPIPAFIGRFIDNPIQKEDTISFKNRQLN